MATDQRIRKDLTGMRFGKLFVIHDNLSDAKIVCTCDCGRTKGFYHNNVIRGLSKSCGGKGCRKYNGGSTKHGMCHTPEWEAWSSLFKRCYGKWHKCFAYYGGRGIRVCDRWIKSFENFYADMGPRPSPKHSIDRIDNDGNYSPENCRWATRKEQQRNRRCNRILEYEGIRATAAEWCEKLGISRTVMDGRIAKKWSDRRIIETPMKH